MEENCQNCNEIITGSFCSNCGQKKFKRIDKRYILDEFQSVVLDINKGFLYSVKSILKNPGKTAIEFIGGNRVNHYKPLLLVFVLSGLATFISYKVLNLKEAVSAYFSQNHINSNLMRDMMSFISNYTTIIMLLFIPIFAIATKIAFRKWGNNYYEHVVMNAYVLSCYTLICIILVYPIMFIFRDSPNIIFNMSQISVLLIPLILLWFYREFYKDKPLKSIILKVFGVLGLLILGYLVFIICTSVSILIYLFLNGPESLQYIAP